ncbi:MAG: cation:proton antiporter [Hungatella sp.]|nr:cation:proton antiporter [Hungatella sp.]
MSFLYSGMEESTAILCSLSIILFAGFLVTRLTKRLRLPNVTGYIIAGVLIGPCCFQMVPKGLLEHMGFISDIALAFIAFGVGKFFKKEILREAGVRVIVVTLFEALAAGILVTLSMKAMFGISWDFALILGAIATATAPASTMMTIHQYHAKGEYVNTLLQVVALDDVVCLLAFSIVVAVVNARRDGSVSVQDVVQPFVSNGAGIFLGALSGLGLSKLLTPDRSKDNRLILSVALLLALSGVCATLQVSPLLSCMVFGAVYMNLTDDRKLFKQINRFTPPIMSMFFIVSGMNLDLGAIPTAGVVGLSYFLIRIVGKYGGVYLGCMVTRMPVNIKRYMGLALIPQAGVAIGLAFLGQRLLAPEIGDLLLTIILASSVLYELVGPACAKMSFFLSGAIKKDVVDSVNRYQPPQLKKRVG